MHQPEEAELLRIYIGETDKHGHEPLYEAIVLAARRRGMAGATVLRGIMGLGADGRLRTAKIIRLSENLPLVVEIVDRPDRIAGLLTDIDGMMAEGLITLERVRVLAYRHGGSRLSAETREGTSP